MKPGIKFQIFLLFFSYLIAEISPVKADQITRYQSLMIKTSCYFYVDFFTYCQLTLAHNHLLRIQCESSITDISYLTPTDPALIHSFNCMSNFLIAGP